MLKIRDIFVQNNEFQDVLDSSDLDQDFRSEIDRRNRIMTGESLTGYTEKENIAAPRPFFPN